MRKEFADWIYREGTIRVRANEQLKVYAPPEVSDAEFARLCREAARKGRDAESAKVQRTYERKIDSLRQKVRRQELDVAEAKADVEARRQDELSQGLATVMGMLGGRRRRSFSSNVNKRRMTTKARNDLTQEIADLEALQRDLSRMEAEMDNALREVDGRWEAAADRVTEVPIAPARSNIYVERFAVAWLPHHIIQAGGQYLILPAHEPLG